MLLCSSIYFLVIFFSLRKRKGVHEKKKKKTLSDFDANYDDITFRHDDIQRSNLAHSHKFFLITCYIGISYISFLLIFLCEENLKRGGEQKYKHTWRIFIFLLGKTDEVMI